MAYKKPLKTANDFAPEVLGLFDKFVHGDIDRRAFLERAGKYAVGGLTAVAMLEALTPNFARAEQIPASDPRIKVDRLDFSSAQGYGKARGYCARPAKITGKLPIVLVVHENRGLNPHIEDIARRLAVENFIAFAPDALFPLGGYPGDEDRARELFSKLDQPKTQEDFVAAAHFIERDRDGNGNLGAVGFCYGGGMVNLLATRLPELRAAVPFYGVAPPLEKVPGIKASLLLQFADTDERVNASWPPYEEALKKTGVKYQMFKYPGTQHGFNNDTTPRYDDAAAKLAWSRTVELFNKTLR